MRTARVRKIVVFDGGCGFCRGSAGLLRALDVFRRLEWIDLSDWERVRQTIPDLDRERCAARIQVVHRDGVRREGFRAIRSIVASLALIWPLLPFLHLPGAGGLGDRAYDAIARRRHTSSCPVPPPAHEGEATERKVVYPLMQGRRGPKGDAR